MTSMESAMAVLTSDWAKIVMGTIVLIVWSIIRLVRQCPECGSSSICDDDCATGGRRD